MQRAVVRKILFFIAVVCLILEILRKNMDRFVVRRKRKSEEIVDESLNTEETHASSSKTVCLRAFSDEYVEAADGGNRKCTIKLTNFFAFSDFRTAVHAVNTIVIYITLKTTL